jgi:hypothetical protein
MRNHTLLASSVLVLALLAPAAASAQEGGGASAHGIGLGATRTLAGISGGTFVYDTSSFHVTGLIGFVTASDDPGPDTTAFALGGQFWYHLHHTSQSDFSVGGGLTIVSFDDGGADDVLNVDLEGGGHMRIFVVPNVALSASLGLLIAIGDDDGTIVGDDSLLIVSNAESTIALGGQVMAALGVTYFFE